MEILSASSRNAIATLTFCGDNFGGVEADTGTYGTCCEPLKRPASTTQQETSHFHCIRATRKYRRVVAMRSGDRGFVDELVTLRDGDGGIFISFHRTGFVVR